MGISGKNFKARIGSPAVAVAGTTRAEIEEMGDELDATDAESDGYGDTEIGVTQLRVALSGFCKESADPIPPLRLGTLLTDVKIYERGLAGDYWSITSALVTKFTNPIDVRGRVEFTCEIKSKGNTYSYVSV